MTLPDSDRWIVALDIDGTVLHEDGTLTDATVEAVQRVAAAGHEVRLATGRSVSMTLPVLERLGIVSRYVVCANGAIVLGRDPEAPLGYARVHVETFDPSEVLGRSGTTSRARASRSRMPTACSATPATSPTARSPRRASGSTSTSSPHVAATRLVVISPDHQIDDFLEIVDRMGLHKVTYNVGWTAWLDIAPEGVNKATGLEFVAGELGIPRSRVLAIGDGRNDIDMLEWVGVGVAMGQAPDEVLAVADETTGSDLEDGVAAVLARRFPA